MLYGGMEIEGMYGSENGVAYGYLEYSLSFGELYFLSLLVVLFEVFIGCQVDLGELVQLKIEFFGSAVSFPALLDGIQLGMIPHFFVLAYLL